MPNPFPFLNVAKEVAVRLPRPTPKQPFVYAGSKLLPTGGDVPKFISSRGGKKALDFVLSTIPQKKPGFTRLFRAEPREPVSPTLRVKLPGMHRNLPELEKVSGRWFTSSVADLKHYLKVRPDSDVLWMDVANNKLQDFKAFVHGTAGQVAEADSEFILPKNIVRQANRVSFDIGYREPRPPRGRIGP